MSKQQRILLVYPPADQGYTCDYLPFTPLALHALKAYVERHSTSTVETLNAANSSYEDVAALISASEPDIVGISSLLISHGMSLRLLEHAKQCGATTVLGGHNASNLAQQVLCNRPYVDFVVRGDGEPALLALINGEPTTTIPNLVHRTGDGIKANTVVQPDLDSLPVLLLEEEDLGWHPIVSHKGCLKREVEGPCVFCGRADKGFRSKTPQCFVDELVFLHDKGHHVLFDVGDDILFCIPWLEEATKLMPTRVSSELSIIAFANIRNINDHTVDLLLDLGISKLVFGIESGDRAVLKKCNKHTDPEVALTRAELCLRRGLSISAAYVLGLPGENTKSLENTLNHASRIWNYVRDYEREALSAVTANLLEPLPGSNVYRGLQKAYPEKYCTRDMLHIEEMQDDYFRRFFRLDSRSAIEDFRNSLMDTARQINVLSPISTPMGIQHKPSVHMMLD